MEARGGAIAALEEKRGEPVLRVPHIDGQYRDVRERERKKGPGAAQQAAMTGRGAEEEQETELQEEARLIAVKREPDAQARPKPNSAAAHGDRAREHMQRQVTVAQ